MSPEPRVWCTRHRFYKGGKDISRSAWYTHKPYRVSLPVQHQQDSSDSDDSSESSSQSDPNSHTADQLETPDAAEDRPRKRRRVDADDDSDSDELDIDNIDHPPDNHAASRSPSPEVDAQQVECAGCACVSKAGGPGEGNGNVHWAGTRLVWCGQLHGLNAAEIRRHRDWHVWFTAALDPNGRTQGRIGDGPFLQTPRKYVACYSRKAAPTPSPAENGQPSAHTFAEAAKAKHDRARLPRAQQTSKPKRPVPAPKRDTAKPGKRTAPSTRLIIDLAGRPPTRKPHPDSLCRAINDALDGRLAVSVVSTSRNGNLVLHASAPACSAQTLAAHRSLIWKTIVPLLGVADPTEPPIYPADPWHKVVFHRVPMMHTRISTGMTEELR
ncbi:hypothetical protein B0H13DRAFT_1888703 [Mycena leptocephala]|nr:hypothetical protein B0H13DRAFT_1888703 [Mycena leptocephala]